MSIRTPAQALAAIAREAKARIDIGTNDCQLNAHEIYGIGSGAATAQAAWEAAKFKHPMSVKPTPGAWVFYTGGKTISSVTGKPSGHVGIQSERDGYLWSPGSPSDPNHWVEVPYEAILTGWPGHAGPVGWTEDNNGVRVPGLAPVVARPNVAAARKAAQQIQQPKKRNAVLSLLDKLFPGTVKK